MVQSQLFVLLIIASIQLFVVAQNVTPKVIAGSGIDQCPLQEERRAAIEEINNSVLDTLQLHRCGDGVWHHVAYLNMSNPSQHCPSA